MKKKLTPDMNSVSKVAGIRHQIWPVGESDVLYEKTWNFGPEDTNVLASGAD
jgi:hypothetical protein